MQTTHTLSAFDAESGDLVQLHVTKIDYTSKLQLKLGARGKLVDLNREDQLDLHAIVDEHLTATEGMDD